MGAGAAALLFHWVPIFEGTIPRGYIDPVGIVTACTGHTETAEMRPYSEEECKTLLDGDLLKHAEGAARCVDFEKMTPSRRAAVVSFAFNVGVARFCDSGFARKLNEGDPRACDELSRWVYAGGRVLPGLVKRREIEKAMCVGSAACADCPPSVAGFVVPSADRHAALWAAQ